MPKCFVCKTKQPVLTSLTTTINGFDDDGNPKKEIRSVALCDDCTKTAEKTGEVSMK